MAARWTSVNGFKDLFPKELSVGSSTLNDSVLPMAERWVEQNLASRFSTPFSGHHLGAIDLAYLKSYHIIRLRSLAPGDSDEMGKELAAQIKSLLAGEAALMTQSGALYAETQDSTPTSEAWSTNEDYAPIFDLEPAEDQRVDPDQLQARYRAKL